MIGNIALGFQMSPTEYGLLLERASNLDAQAQMCLLADLAAMVRDGGRPKERHGIMEFMGIAKGSWKNADVQGYLEEERASWEP